MEQICIVLLRRQGPHAHTDAQAAENGTAARGRGRAAAHFDNEAGQAHLVHSLISENRDEDVMITRCGQ